MRRYWATSVWLPLDLLSGTDRSVRWGKEEMSVASHSRMR
jgi:hypothetical protein